MPPKCWLKEEKALWMFNDMGLGVGKYKLDWQFARKEWTGKERKKESKAKEKKEEWKGRMGSLCKHEGNEGRSDLSETEYGWEYTP